MAKVTSGSFNTTKYDGRYYTFSWTATQDIATNKSSIAWSLEAKGGNSSWYAERTVEVVVAGETVYSKTAKVNRYTGKVASGTKVITHNTNGSKSFSASVKAAVYTSSVNCTGSGNWDLTDIPRAATITSATNFNDEQNPTINYSNAAGNAVAKIEACIASADGKIIYVPYREINKTATSYTFNDITEAQRNNLRKAVTSGNTATVKFYIRTTINSTTTFHNSVAKTLTLINYTPTLTPVVKDVGTVTTKLTGNENTVIKYYNYMSVDSGAAARKEATIKSIKITCGNKSITTSSGALQNVEVGDFVFSVTDNRGNITTQTVKKTFIDYVKLTCNLTAKIALDTSTTSKITFTAKGNYWSGNFGAVANSLTVQYRLKQDNGEYGDWVTTAATLNGNTYTATGSIAGLDYQSTYTIQARAIDAISSGGVNTEGIGLTTTPLFDWGKDDFQHNTTVYMKAGKAIASKTNDGTDIVNMIYLNAGDNVTIGGGSKPPKRIFLTAEEGVTINGVEFGKNQVLWSGASFMGNNQSVDLSGNKAITKQTNGIVLAFSAYTGGAAQDYAWNLFFIPKCYLIDALDDGGGTTFIMATENLTYIGAKYLYINNTTITGKDTNSSGATVAASGITCTNNYFVLRYVLGV